jgi:hypothetical protein
MTAPPQGWMKCFHFNPQAASAMLCNILVIHQGLAGM